MELIRKTASAVQKGAEVGLAILNGVFGDYLKKINNPLAISMKFYHQGKPLGLNSENLSQVKAELTPKVCLLIHGLVGDEKIWNYPEQPETNYGTLLQSEMGFSLFTLRYNSGLHISENGKNLSELFDRLMKIYPRPVEEIIIIAHSMGGLVIRSACHYAKRGRLGWIKKIRKIFFIASPLDGAPLEKFGNITSGILGAIPSFVTRLTKDIIDLRSSGIKDLRYGYIVDEEWKDKNPDAFLQNNRIKIPFLKWVDYYSINGTLTKDPDHLVAQLIGDALVTRPSSCGQSENGTSAIPPERRKEFPGVHHLKLPHSPEIYAQIRLWCGEKCIGKNE